MSIIPQLLEAVKHNNARQIDSVALYEIGSVFLKQENELLPDEREHVAAAITGLWEASLWQGEKKAVDFYVLKGVLEALIAALGVADKIGYRQAGLENMHPGRTAEVLLNGEVIGFIGQVHPTVQKELDLKDTYVFELSFKKIAEAEVEPISYESIPRFPSITRDIALVVEKKTVAGDLVEIIREAGGALLKEVHIFDLYEGEHMEAGKKSLAYTLKYFAPERTLTDEEVTKTHEKVLKAVEEKAGAVLRS
jgi:phenylalanyl-tRNA synthetase beta chain